MRRYLVVANLGVGSQTLRDFVRRRSAEEPSVFHLVVPTVPSTDRLTWDEGEARGTARERLAHGLAWLRAVDPRAEGEIGDPDVLLAIADALRDARYDAIVLSMGAPVRSRWLRADLPTRARRAFGMPVVEVFDGAPAEVTSAATALPRSA